MTDAISSPCVDICALDQAGRVCTGCGRTREEIGQWPTASTELKHAILARAAERRRTVTNGPD